MTTPENVIQGVRSSPGGRSGGLSSLPPDVLSQSCKRVGTAAIVFAAVWAIYMVLPLVLQDPETYPFALVFPMPGYLVCGVGVVVSIGMAFVAGRLHDRPQLLLTLGLGFEVFSAFLLGFLNFWLLDVISQAGGSTASLGVSWIVLIILVYPAIAPNTPARILVASLLAASMDPLGLLIALASGAQLDVSLASLMNWFLPTYIAAFLAVIPANIISSLSRKVKHARDLGSYRLEEVLGRGGMGEVHRATHRMLARPAAIKLIRPDVLASGGDMQSVVIERFKREASAAAELRSPHTIELYDFGVSADGTFYYVMELLDGLDLESLVTKHGPVPPERAIHFLRQMSLSLGEAHMHRLIHRDIKPANVYASRLGLSVDFIKILDFGLVKALGTPQDVKLTAPEMTTGTPAYMAPEVAFGEDVDARADVYSLGCVTYWLLTGQLVFEAESPVKMMYRHIQEDPIPPSQRTELEIPQALDDLIMSALEKRPEDRPAHASEFGDRLREIGDIEPWTDERARQWWERHCPTAPVGEACEPRMLAPALSTE